MSEKEHVQQALTEVGNGLSYIYHLVATKPVAVAFAGVLSAVMSKVSAGLPDHLLSATSLCLLVFIDWLTKYHACRKQGIPFTSKVMREKGVLKLRDYMLLYIAGACTIPLLGDQTGFKAAVSFMAIVELWSVAENLNDSGNLPFDPRKIAVFDMIRNMMKGGAAKPEAASTPAAEPKQDKPEHLPAGPDAPAQ